MSDVDDLQERFDELKKKPDWGRLHLLVEKVNDDMDDTPLKKAVLGISEAATELGAVGNSGEFHDYRDEWNAWMGWIEAVLTFRQVLKDVQT